MKGSQEYDAGFDKVCEANGVDPDALIKYSFEASDLLRGLPIVGGGLHGLASPAQGANRAETGVLEGGGGAIGGVAGALLGAHAGQSLNEGKSDPDSIIPILAALAGSSAGTALGSIPGRFLAERNTPSMQEVKKLKAALEKYKKQSIGKGININISTGMPEEADEESGEDDITAEDED